MVERFREYVAGRVGRLLGDHECASASVALYLSHHAPDGLHGLWTGFEAARLEVLSQVARGEGCPAVLVFGLHTKAVVLQHEAAAVVLAHPAIQYLRFSQLANETALAEALAAAVAGRGAPMPPAFQLGSLDELRKALSGIAHCLHNVLPIVQGWVEAARKRDTGALPTEIPAFARRDQRESLERLAVFEPLARALSGGALSLQPVVDDWHALERAWQELQRTVADSPIDDVPGNLQARLQIVQTATGQVMARIQEAQTRLRQAAGERAR